MAKRDHCDLCTDGGDGEWFAAVPEELVEEGEEDAGERAKCACAKGDSRESGIICCWYSKCNLLDWRVFLGVR